MGTSARATFTQVQVTSGTAPSAISGGYTIANSQTISSQTASHAYLYNTASFSQPTWTVLNSFGLEGAIAFKEIGAGKNPQNFPRVIGG